MRFVYNFSTYLLPLAFRIQSKDFIKNKIGHFFDKYTSDIFFDLSNLDEYEINSLLEMAIKAVNVGLTEYPWVRQRLEKEIINRKLIEEASKDMDGESEQVEFKKEISTLNQLAKEIAAFASVDGGRIYLGISDDGKIIGIDEKEFNFDKFQQDLANITTNTIKPSIKVKIELFYVGEKTIIQIRIPKGTEPVYYIGNKPYIRVLTTSRPATPSELKNLRVQYFINLLQGSIT